MGNTVVRETETPLVNAKMGGEVSTVIVCNICLPDSLHDVDNHLSNAVCKTDSSCNGFPLPGGVVVDDPGVEVNMTCYKGGETIFNNHQMCDVTSMSNQLYIKASVIV